jgi:ATP-dependent Clp protease protease subunit
MSLKYTVTVVCFQVALLGHSPVLHAENTPETAQLPTATEQIQPEKVTQPVTPQPEEEDDDETSETPLTIQDTITLGTTLQNFLQALKYKMELMKLTHERDKLALESELKLEKNRHKLAELTTEKDRLLLENELQEAKRIKGMSDLNAEKDRLELENAVRIAKQQQQFFALEEERNRLAAHNALQEEKNRQQDLVIQLENLKLTFEISKLEYEKAKRSMTLEELNEKIAERNSREEWDNQINRPKEYLDEPFVNGRLIISDRRIYLDGPILPGTSDYINERIDYFNNKDPRYPIFLVIDRCAGGSVMEGAKILKAMHTSPAPVYVVVKSFAASMAAVIATLAKRSFAYPNALFVHHQIWAFTFGGNPVQQQESLDMTNEWARRLMQPVAEKMGITLEEFVKQMYQHNSEGNWSEFSDKAKELKWIDTVVDEIREMSFDRKPNDSEDEADILKRLIFSSEERVDKQGVRYMELPHLGPLDVYYLYNPNHYYR